MTQFEAEAVITALKKKTSESVSIILEKYSHDRDAVIHNVYCYIYLLEHNQSIWSKSIGSCLGGGGTCSLSTFFCVISPAAKVAAPTK